VARLTQTASSARTITLPPFLITMLRKHLERHNNEFVFTAEGRTWLWRSAFIRRVLKPAVNGNEGRPRAGTRTVPIRPGLTFHGLRHSHKTWLNDLQRRWHETDLNVRAHPTAPDPSERHVSGPLAA
jgi:integrase